MSLLSPPIEKTSGCGSSTRTHLAGRDQIFALPLHLRDRAGRQDGTAPHLCPQRDHSTAAVHRSLGPGHATYAYGVPGASDASPRHCRTADQTRSSAAHLGGELGSARLIQANDFPIEHGIFGTALERKSKIQSCEGLKLISVA